MNLDLTKLKVALNHILDNQVNAQDFDILDKYGLINYHYVNNVQYMFYPNKKDVRDILKSIGE